MKYSDLELAISGDGQYVVFKSFAENLVSSVTDNNHNSDIFLFNRQAAAGSNITLVSHSSSSLITAATGGSASSETPAISADGRYIAYKSTASNIVTGDANSAYDVFLFDRLSGGNTIVSHAASSSASANSGSGNPVISADASFIAYSSLATDLVSGQTDSNGAADVFLYSLTGGSNSLVSGAGASATSTGNSASGVSSINSDGSAIVFVSLASDLAGTDSNDQPDVFVSVKSVPKFSFRSENFTTQENGVTAQIRIDRNGDTSISAAVDYRVISGTATADVDFVGDTDTLVFAPGELSRTIEVTILDDRLLESNETILLELFDPSPGSALGSPSQATLTIRDNDGLDLISVNSDGSGTGNDQSGELGSRILISDDGRFVAFDSYARNLVSGVNDGNEIYDTDVYVRDRLTGTTKLISRSLDGTSSGNSQSFVLDMSANGAFVLFSSQATDLWNGNDTNGGADIFLYNAILDTITLVSVNRDGDSTGNDWTVTASMSNDGALVLLKSDANDLLDEGVDTNSTSDLYLRDLVLGQTTLVTETLAGTASGATHFGALTGNGQFVLFATSTSAEQLVSGVSDPQRSISGGGSLQQNDLFVRDLHAGTTRIVTVDSTGLVTGDQGATQGVLSEDGNFVAFDSFGSNYVSAGGDPNSNGDVFLRNMTSGTTKLLRGDSAGTTPSSPGRPFGFSSSGQFLLFQSEYPDVIAGIADTNEEADIFVYDLEHDTTLPVSINAAGNAMGNEAIPDLFSVAKISANGKFVVFVTPATDLDPSVVAVSGRGNIALRDLDAGTTTILSRNADGVLNNHSSGFNNTIVITPDGEFVAFATLATDVIPDVADTNGENDIYISPGTFEPGTFEFDSIDVSVSEDGDTALLTIKRTGGSNGTFVLFFSTSSVNGTATPNQDYSIVSSSVTFLDGETSVTIGIPVLDDGKDETNETFTVTLDDGSLDLLGNQATATVTIVDQDTAIVGNQVIESDGDILAVSLKGAGTFTLTRNGNGQLDVALAGTNASSSILTFTVTKNSGDGLANVGAITGTGGLKSLAGAKVNLTGDGLALGGTVLTLALNDVLNGADITLGGSPSDFIKLTLHKIDDNTNINLGSGVKSLTAARIGRGNIFGTSIQTLSIKGDKSRNIRGDMFSNIFLSGQGISGGGDTLGKVTVSHAITDAIFSVFAGSGGIGSITAGRMQHSGISAGFTPADFSRPLNGGTFGPALTIKTVNIKGIAGEGTAFANSVIAAKTVGTVTLGSIDQTTTVHDFEDYGVLADVSIGKVTVKVPKFAWNTSGPADQNVSRFHVKVI